MVRYYGGKGVIGKKVSTVIMNYIEQQDIMSPIVYLEPFCGALGVCKHLAHKFDRVYANDLCEDMILLWNAVKYNQFSNPHITKDKWNVLKNEKSSAERGFAAHACSFCGVWFRGFVDENDQQYNTLMKMAQKIQNVIFENYDYRYFLQRHVTDPTRHYVIYMDPPYEGTENMEWDNEPFDHKEFWNQVRKYDQLPNVTILVSELHAPDDFEILATIERTNGFSRRCETKIVKENIYVHKNETLDREYKIV